MWLWFFFLIGLVPGELLYEGSAVAELDYAKFTSVASKNKWVIVFYAHWCGHCQHFAPEFIKIAESHSKDETVRFGGVDCATPASFKLGEEDLCKAMDVKAYPTIFLFSDGKKVRELAKTPPELSVEISKISSTGNLGEEEVIGKLAVPETPQNTAIEPSVDPQTVLDDAALAWYQIFHDSVFPGAAERLDSQMLQDLLVICTKSLLPRDFRDGCGELLQVAKNNPQGLSRSIWMREIHDVFGNDWEGKQFKSCKDFSCGMWRVLHLITLSIDSDFPADEALRSVRFVVDNYFQCAVCREHFLAHYDQCDFDRCSMVVDAVNVPAWLIRLHNGVNSRLGKPLWSGHELEDNEQLVNKLKNDYGLSENKNQLIPAYLVLVLIFFVVILSASCVRYLGSTTVDRIRFSVTKKYQPLNIV